MMKKGEIHALYQILESSEENIDKWRSKVW